MCVYVWLLSHVLLFSTSWTVACQAPLSMGFSRKQHWSGLPCPSPGDLPDPGIKPPSPALASGFFTAEPPGRPLTKLTCTIDHHGIQLVEPRPCTRVLAARVRGRRELRFTATVRSSALRPAKTIYGGGYPRNRSGS